MGRRILFNCFLALCIVYALALPKNHRGSSERDSKSEEEIDWNGKSNQKEDWEVQSDEDFDWEGQSEDFRQNKRDLASHPDAVNVGSWWGHKGVHNLTVGYKTYQDRLLYSGNIYKPYKIWRIVEQNLDVRSPHGEQISFIEAYDSHPSASDAGYASIVGGGVGARQVTIHLESARGHGLKYYVRVFGHY